MVNAFTKCRLRTQQNLTLAKSSRSMAEDSRAYSPRRFLAHVEADLGINICDHFDLITGTSTGGIIAIGLALGLRPKEILDFYLNEGPTIFPQGVVASPLRRFRHWFLNKFDAAVLEKALRRTFGDRKLGDCMKRLVIPSFSLEANDVYLFKTPHHPRLRRDLHVPAWQAALATASAPTFFQAAKAPDHQRLVDGGIWANNPSLVGLTEAHATLGCPLEQVSILNIGTSTECKEWPKRRDWGGKISWAADVADLIMSSQSQAISKQCGLLLRERFYRLDIQVPAGAFALDRYDHKNSWPVPHMQPVMPFPISKVSSAMKSPRFIEV